MKSEGPSANLFAKFRKLEKNELDRERKRETKIKMKMNWVAKKI
jgi:hypothetical protein